MWEVSKVVLEICCFISKLYLAKERISKLEDILIELADTGSQDENWMK